MEQSPEVINTLIQRGITNDLRSRELFESLNPQQIGSIKKYLSSDSTLNEKEIEKLGFPNIDSKIIDQLEKQKLSMNSPEVLNLVKSLLPSDYERLEMLIKRKHDRLSFIRELKEIASEYQRLNKKVKNFLAVQKESLRLIFPMTVKAQIGKHYVLDREGTSAIPADNGTPLWDSQFGSSLERLYYTTFSLFEKGVNQDIVRSDLNLFVERFRELIIQKITDLEAGNDFDLSNDQLMIEFKERYGTTVPLREKGFTESDIQLLTNWVNEHPARQIPFIRNYIFPELKIYPREIETTTHMFPLIAKPKVGLRGMTGTLFNKATFPKIFGKVDLSDTIHKVVDRIKSCTQERTISVSSVNKPEQIFEEIYAKSALGPGSLIDTTGYIKKENGESYARLMLKEIHEKTPEITSVVYYEGDNLMAITLGQEFPRPYDGRLPRNSLAALWDIAHTTGSNIIIHPTGHAFLLVGKHLRLFELAQASMRLRGLGAGQRLEIVVSETDRSIIIDKLSQYLDLQINKEEMLTVDQVIQYALINEISEETENNWRAINMRMQVVVLDAVMKSLWGGAVPPEQLMTVFQKVKELFVKDKGSAPWELYGQLIVKTGVEEAKGNLLKTWKAHPVLEMIRSNPKLFPNVDVDNIIQQFEAIIKENAGPLQPTVDTENYTGQKLRVQAKVQLKVKNNVKENVRRREKTQIRVKRKIFASKPKKDVPALRREPFRPLPVVPLPLDLFSRRSYNTIPLQKAATLDFQQLQPQRMFDVGAGAAIDASELLTLAPSLKKAFQINDDAISFSLNLAPVWIAEGGESPLYTPYNFFQKFASHALLIEDKATNTLKLRLVDFNDAEAILTQLEYDRKHPEDEKHHDVRLTLYHLHENRVVASGSSPVNPDNKVALEKRKIELITQAKLLSGITSYTDQEKAFLEKWLVERNPLEILEQFVLNVIFNQERSLEWLQKSHFGKVLMSSGVDEEVIDNLLKSPQVIHRETIRTLLFDRSLSAKEWLKKALELKEAFSSGLQAYAGASSDVVVPLLPVLFDLLNVNRLASYKHEAGFFDEKGGVISENAVRRRWLMNTFFPSIADEYGAWRTAVPQLVNGLGGDRSRLTNLFEYRSWGTALLQVAARLGGDHLLPASSLSKPGSDPDEVYFNNVFAEVDTNRSKPVVATTNQLEAMSELAHPLWGLPGIVNAPSVGEFAAIAGRVKKYMEEAGDQFSYYMPQDTVEVSKTDSSIALMIANKAIGHIDLVASLRSIQKDNPDYAYERLFGVFALLAKQDLIPEARREYALHMLPRFYREKFNHDMRFYTDFIPQALSVLPENYTKTKIDLLLEECYRASDTTKEWIVPDDSSDSNPSSWERSLALRSFALDASKEIAELTAQWINNLLQKQSPKPSWWIDALLLQFVKRPKQELLIDHQEYGLYFTKNNLRHLQRAYFVHVSPELFNEETYHFLSQLNLKDFDLFADIVKLPTANKPSFTPYEMANKWTQALEPLLLSLEPLLLSNGAIAPPSRALWHKILGGISASVRQSPPTNEIDKNALKGLIKLLDQYSKNLSDSEFADLHNELGNIRLAAEYSFELPQRREFLMEEIKKLPFETELYRRIYFHFIPNFLLTSSECAGIEPAAIKTLLSDLQRASKEKPEGQWKPVVDHIMRPFTLNGTAEQQKAVIESMTSFLQTIKGRIPFVDTMLFAILDQYAEKLQNKDFIEFVLARDKEAIAAFIGEMVIYASNSMSERISDLERLFLQTDIELIADLFGLKTNGRTPFSQTVLTQKVTALLLFRESIKEFDSPLKKILEIVYDRGRILSDSKRDQPAISNLLKVLEEHYKAEPDEDLLKLSNLLRYISDYSDPNANKNLENALVELFELDPMSFRFKAYELMIPELQDQTKSASWVGGVLEKISQLPKRNQLIKHLEIVDRTLIDVLEKYPNQVEHSGLINFVKGREVKFIEFIVSNPEVQKFFGNDLELVADLFELKTANRRNLSTSDVAHKSIALIEMTNDFSTVTSPLMQIMNSLLNRGAQGPYSSEDKKSISNFIRAVESKYKKIPRKDLVDLLNKLRMKVDFTDSSEKNIVRAFEELLDSSTSTIRAEIYFDFIPQFLFSMKNTDADTFIPAILDVINRNEKFYYSGKSIDLLFSLIKSDETILRYQAVAKWYQKAKVSPDLAKPLLNLFFDNFSLLQYSQGESLWRILGGDKIRLISSLMLKGRFDLSEDLINTFVRSNFRLIASFFKLGLEKAPEATLLGALQDLNSVSPFVTLSLESRKKLCNFVESKLPTLLKFFKGSVSSEEAKELSKFIAAISEQSLEVDDNLKSSIDNMKSRV